MGNPVVIFLQLIGRNNIFSEQHMFISMICGLYLILITGLISKFYILRKSKDIYGVTIWKVLMFERSLKMKREYIDERILEDAERVYRRMPIVATVLEATTLEINAALIVLSFLGRYSRVC